MITVEGGTILKAGSRYIAYTHSDEAGSFATLSAATHWLAMDYEITESRAKRKGEGA